MPRGWGAKVIKKLSHDLRVAFPEMKGFSRANLMYMRAFAEAWPDAAIVQQSVGQLPWGHNLVLRTAELTPLALAAESRQPALAFLRLASPDLPGKKRCPD